MTQTLLTIPSTRRRLVLEKSGAQTLHVLAEGLAPAVVILASLMTLEHWADYFVALDDMNIRGQQIVAAYKHACNGNLGLFAYSLSTRDAFMVRIVNEQCVSVGFQELAVQRGGAAT